MAVERVVLVDGSALLYRAFYALPSTLQTAGGVPTNATYGFATMCRKVFAGKRPALGAVVFDAPGKSFRDERFAEYKAHRPSMPGDLRAQLANIDRVVDAFGLPRLRVPGYEADDVIGTLTRMSLEAGHEVYIVSGDKDFAQLVGERVRMLDTMRDVSYDSELVRKKWGVPPAQIVDYLALVGDKADNVPGVPGIGAKSAASLLERYGSLEGVLAHVHELKGKQKQNLEENVEVARLSKELVTLDLHVDLATLADLKGLVDLALRDPVPAEVNALFVELEFNSLLEADPAGVQAEADGAPVSTARGAAEVDAFLALAPTAPLAVELGYEGETPVSATYVGAALAHEQGRLFIPAEAEDAAQESLSRALADPSRPKVMHNVRDAYCVLWGQGREVRGLALDTQLASFLVDPTGAIPHELDQVARAFLQRALPALPAPAGRRSKATLLESETDARAAFLGARAQAALELRPVLEEVLERDAQRAIHDGTSLPLSRVLARMQVAGIRVDAAALGELSAEFQTRKEEIEAEIYALAGREFNLASPKQLGEVLFEELGLPVQKRTKTGYSTDAAVLEKLANEHVIAGLIVRQRALAKLINTYTEVLRAAIDPRTGRVHCTFQQTAGASGRLITTAPDLQRTPIRTDDGKRIRAAFVPAEGALMVSADWSQIELRLLAHLSEDPALMHAFQANVDVHRRTAAEIFGKEPDALSPQERNVGKTVNFATIYGQGATALAQSLHVPRAEAKRYIERYFEVYQGVRRWLDGTIAQAHERGFVETMLGRRRLVPELSSGNFATRAYGERIAANTPIQGSAADLCKVAMLHIAARLESDALEAKMLLQIHDELIFEVSPAHLDALLEAVRHEMENAWPTLRVPLVVDIGHGASWEEAHG